MKILIATGHVTPAVPVARMLVPRGHEVRWCTGRAHKDTADTGATYEPPLVDAHEHR
jgi:UDP:flavonoid glycosyltransferase YjiC (YdhE family)